VLSQGAHACIQGSVLLPHPGRPPNHAVAGLAQQVIRHTIQTHFHERQRAGITARVRKRCPAALTHSFILPRQVQQHGISCASLGALLRWVRALHHRQARRIEKPAACVNLLAVILRAHEGVLPAHAPYLLRHKSTVCRYLLADRVGRQTKNPLDAVTRLGSLCQAQLACQKGLVRPGCTPKDARGVRAGSHGGNLLVKFVNAYVLRLVHLQQRGRGRSDDVGFWRGG